MNKRTVAVIGTNEALLIHDGLNIRESHPSDFLLKLVDDGYEIFILSTRSEDSLTLHDGHWLDLIPKDHIYFNTGEQSAESLGIISNWKALFQRLDLTPPKNDFNWLNWRSAAKKQGIITDSSDLE